MSQKNKGSYQKMTNPYGVFFVMLLLSILLLKFIFFGDLTVKKTQAVVGDVAVSGQSISVTGDINASGRIKQGGNELIPAGVMMPYAGSSAPAGWLFTYGQAISRTTYASLFTAIGTTYGPGDGTTFNLPDMRGRTPKALDNMGGSDAGRLSAANTLGGGGGQETIPTTTSSTGAWSGGRNAGHVHNYAWGGSGWTWNQSTENVDHAHYTTVSYTLPNAFAGSSLPPYILTNYIIKY